MSEPTQPQSPPRVELRRSRTDRMIGGVAAGLARYLNADPVLVRVGWVVGAFLTGGTAVLAYIVCWIVIPEEGADASAYRAAVPNDRGRFVLGAILVVGGLLWLASTVVPQVFAFQGLGAIVLIAIGIVLVVQGARR